MGSTVPPVTNHKQNKIGARWVPLSALTVRAATALQLGPLEAERRRRVDVFVSECSTQGGHVHPDVRSLWVACVLRAQRQLWRVRWDNRFKEVYWRLVLNGLATPARLHVQQPCGVCGTQPGPAGRLIDRLHHFWQCPVARAVVNVIQQQLPAAWCAQPLLPPNILFMHRPAGATPATTVHTGVWRVVCLAAVCAMDVGRRAAARHQRQLQVDQAAQAAHQQPVPPGQPLITNVFQPAVLTQQLQQRQQAVRQRLQQQQQQLLKRQGEEDAARLASAKQAAVARFWELLQDFTVMRAAPAAWLLQVAPDHPLLRVQAGLQGVQCVAVVAPGGIAPVQ